MSYQVLSRKWRPQRFEEVLGQDHVIQTLQNALQRDRVAHAYMFTGPRGVGKTTTARILAKALNCRNREDATPCNQCTPCEEITRGNSLDVLEIDGASNRGIDEIRELREAVKYPPVSGNYRIYIIDEVHMLTTQAFNALLKTLEEPPPHVKFILATTDPQKVPQTILSRTQRFDFRRVSARDIAQLMDSILKTEDIAHTEQALLLLGRKADGSIRDGLSLLDQVIAYSTSNIDEDAVSAVLGLVDDAFFLELLDSIGSNNFEGILAQVEVIFDRGYDLQEMAQGFNVTIRDAIISLETSEAAMNSRGVLVQAPAGMTSTDLMALLQIGLETEAQLRYARQPRVLLEHQWLKMAALDRTVSIQQLITDMGDEPSPAGRSRPEEAPARAAAPSAPAPQPSTTDAKPEPVEQSSPRRSFRRGGNANDDPAESREPARPASMATADQVRSHWSDIQSDIALKSAATAAMLEGAELEDLDDGRIALHLRASEAIHLDMIVAKRKMLEEIIAARLGQSVSLVPTIPESALPADSETGTSGAGDAALEKLIDTFSGEDY